MPPSDLPVLQYLQKYLDGALSENDVAPMRYPTAISQTLGMRIAEIGAGAAVLEMDANPDKHGNQQGTIHGGLLCELADAAIGTAHSTLMQSGETFTSLEIKVNFFRPCWKTRLRAAALPLHSGKTIAHYRCDITREDGKIAAAAFSTIMTLRGEQAQGR